MYRHHSECYIYKLSFCSQALHTYNQNMGTPKVYRNDTPLGFNSRKIQTTVNDIWRSGSVLRWLDELRDLGINNIRSFDITQQTNHWSLSDGDNCCSSTQQPALNPAGGRSNNSIYIGLHQLYD